MRRVFGGYTELSMAVRAHCIYVSGTYGVKEGGVLLRKRVKSKPQATCLISMLKWQLFGILMKVSFTPS